MKGWSGAKVNCRAKDKQSTGVLGLRKALRDRWQSAGSHADSGVWGPWLQYERNGRKGAGATLRTDC